MEVGRVRDHRHVGIGKGHAKVFDRLHAGLVPVAAHQQHRLT